MEHRFDRLEQLLRLVLAVVQQRATHKEHYNVTEAAEVLGLSPFHIRQLLKAKVLKGYKSNRRSGPFQKWVIPAAAIREFDAGRNGDQEPPDTAGCPVRPTKPPKAPPARKRLAKEVAEGTNGHQHAHADSCEVTTC